MAKDWRRIYDLTWWCNITFSHFKYFIFFILLKELSLRKWSFWRLRSVILDRRRFWLSINSSSRYNRYMDRNIAFDVKKMNIFLVIISSSPPSFIIFLLSSKLKNKIPRMKLTYEIWLLFHPRMEICEKTVDDAKYLKSFVLSECHRKKTSNDENKTFRFTLPSRQRYDH